MVKMQILFLQATCEILKCCLLGCIIMFFYLNLNSHIAYYSLLLSNSV